MTMTTDQVSEIADDRVLLVKEGRSLIDRSEPCQSPVVSSWLKTRIDRRPGYVHPTEESEMAAAIGEK
jgi:hypothetical protein